MQSVKTRPRHIGKSPVLSAEQVEANYFVSRDVGYGIRNIINNCQSNGLAGGKWRLLSTFEINLLIGPREWCSWW